MREDCINSSKKKYSPGLNFGGEFVIKDTLKAFDDFRNKQQKCMK